MVYDSSRGDVSKLCAAVSDVGYGAEEAKVEEDLLNGIRQRPDDIFYVSQAVLTPDANVVTTGWTRGITSLRDMAMKWMNPKFSDLLPRLNEAALDAEKHVNIIIADFYQHGSFVELCLRLNLQNAER